MVIFAVTNATIKLIAINEEEGMKSHQLGLDRVVEAGRKFQKMYANKSKEDIEHARRCLNEMDAATLGAYYFMLH